MRLRNYAAFGSRSARLLICELIRCTKASFLAFCMILLLIALNSRLFAQVKEASFNLRSSSIVYLPPENNSWLGEESSILEETSMTFPIQDIVLLPDDILLLIRFPEYAEFGHQGLDNSLPPKEQLTCLFDNAIPTPLTGLDYSRGRALVRCHQPQESTHANVVSKRVSSDGAQSDLSLSNSHEVKHFSRVCLLQQSRVVAQTAYVRVKTWHFLVFEVWATKKDVVVFAKGINTKQGHDVNPSELACVFGGDIGGDAQMIETNVSISAQEVFRCAHPPSKVHRRKLVGKAVTLRWGTKMLPTVAYYEEFSKLDIMSENIEAPPQKVDIPVTPQHIPARQATAPVKEICVCTMIFNVAKFLPEWGSFHSHVGVDRFILYDNNSEDELGEALRWLRDRKLQVNRYPWPWPKTQEAGFSHCVLLAARQSCEWLLFADVDEFLFPAAHLPPSGRQQTPLRQLIADAERRGMARWQQKHGAAISSDRQPAPSGPEGLHYSVIATDLPRKGSVVPRDQAGQGAISTPSDKPTGSQVPVQYSAKVTDLPRRGSALPRQTELEAKLTPSSSWQGVSQWLNGPPIRVGQVSFMCRDFGPSNLTRHPTQGVTQGYVCRCKTELRHKSLVQIAAVAPDLQNVVHHFSLLPEYTTLTEHPTSAVVYHYKYQAWPEFRQKFRRRVSAYVADWGESRNMESRDRTPGLGARDLKPANWEAAFCEVLDTALRDYCNTTFAVKSSTLTWQL